MSPILSSPTMSPSASYEMRLTSPPQTPPNDTDVPGSPEREKPQIPRLNIPKRRDSLNKLTRSSRRLTEQMPLHKQLQQQMQLNPSDFAVKPSATHEMTALATKLGETCIFYIII
jgi:hypothetical protein